MLPLAQKQQPELAEPAQRFWIDPAVEVALTAQINEHFPREGYGLDGLARSPSLVQSPALMDCYNQDNPDCIPGLPSSRLNGGGGA